MEWLIQLDGGILLFIQDYIRMDFMNGFWQFITSLGDKGWFWIVVSVLLLIPKKTRYIGIAALLSLTVNALITNVTLKPLVARTRPYVAIEGLNILAAAPHDFSFPSGHTSASFAAALVYLRKMPKKYGVCFVVLATLIAFSRLYVGVHYPTDVLAGFLIGVFSSWAVCRWMEYFPHRKRMPEQAEAEQSGKQQKSKAE